MDRSTRNRFYRLWHGRPRERRSATAVTRRSGDGGRGLRCGCLYRPGTLAAGTGRRTAARVGAA
ncbi:hypothetical protein GLA29479_4315 [Lysobacter antibioticus]|nr:hypothetical protein GLA29479_4315 [Lysobacter antibioticus]